MLPFLALGDGVFSAPSQYWDYVRSHLLGAYFSETIVLTASVGAAVFALGTALAWVISFYDFRGKSFFEATLILPLAIPPYIAAYSYDGLVGYTGIIQTFSRNVLGLSLSRFISGVPATVWAVFVFSVTLFPYVYILTRTFLLNQSAAVFENARMLGGGNFRLFFRVGLPLLWPSASAGAILSGLETLNDFGVSSYYGLTTFTTAIFTAWFGMGDADTAVKLALILLGLVFIVLLIRKALRNARRYQIVSTKERRLVPQRARGAAQGLIIILCTLTFLAGFGFPVLQMFYWLTISFEGAFNDELLKAVIFTLKVSILATFIIMLAATGTANANRLFRTRLANLFSQGATLGYSIPSAVLAIGVISFFIWSDKIITGLVPFIEGRPLSQGLIILIFAFCLRFFTIGYQAVEAGFAKTNLTLTEASRTLGRGVNQTFLLVDLPLLKPALLSGAALVFIDILKELPLSLLLRPFNTETLGTTVYHFSKNEVLEQTALPSLGIILVGTIFILIMRFWSENGAKRVSGS
ncbi:MAG: iron ABC transporter permease [Deltaproteobacteria bacterium]|nr:iron ABC transporter permease [Deltaproteobacteria bacterium]